MDEARKGWGERELQKTYAQGGQVRAGAERTGRAGTVGARVIRYPLRTWHPAFDSMSDTGGAECRAGGVEE